MCPKLLKLRAAQQSDINEQGYFPKAVLWHQTLAVRNVDVGFDWYLTCAH